MSKRSELRNQFQQIWKLHRNAEIVIKHLMTASTCQDEHERQEQSDRIDNLIASLEDEINDIDSMDWLVGSRHLLELTTCSLTHLKHANASLKARNYVRDMEWLETMGHVILSYTRQRSCRYARRIMRPTHVR